LGADRVRAATNNSKGIKETIIHGNMAALAAVICSRFRGSAQRGSECTLQASMTDAAYAVWVGCALADTLYKYCGRGDMPSRQHREGAGGMSQKLTKMRITVPFSKNSVEPDGCRKERDTLL